MPKQLFQVDFAEMLDVDSLGFNVKVIFDYLLYPYLRDLSDLYILIVAHILDMYHVLWHKYHKL